MQTFSASELESQAVLELPDRELMGGLITITGVNILSFDTLNVVTSIANNSFNNWHISALNGNSVDLTVTDNLDNNSITTFCNQVVAVLSLVSCGGQVDP